MSISYVGIFEQVPLLGSLDYYRTAIYFFKKRLMIDNYISNVHFTRAIHHHAVQNYLTRVL